MSDLCLDEPDEAFARRHGYTLVVSRRGWRVLSPRDKARCVIDGWYYAGEADAWLEAARRIRVALNSQRVKAVKRAVRRSRHG